MSKSPSCSFEEKYTQEVVDLILPIQRDEFNINISIEDQPDLCESRKNTSILAEIFGRAF